MSNATTTAASKPATTSGTPMLDRLLAMKPLYRFAIFAVLAIAIWIVAQDYTWKAAADLDAESNRLSRIIDDAATRNSMIEGNDAVRSAVLAFGEARIPRDDRDGTEALQKSVDRAVKDTKIVYSLDVRSSGKFPAGAFPGIASPGERIEKVVGDMKFEASQAVAIQVLERLEASPDIESVSRVKLTKKSDSKLQVQLTVEAWVRVPDFRAR
ncbi:MAG: hypothetical protein JNM94_13705 [Phycisphaerae bacterium]|nr:hypothetical protein [Phycisphaerae bacterium]